MKTSSIYVYDNKVGVSLPSQINVYPVELLLGNTISEVHEKMQPCYLFCIFTHLNQYDFIVQSNEAAKQLQTILNFGKYGYTVGVEESSVWYSSKAERCLIISDSVTIPTEELCQIISLYRTEIINTLKAQNKIPPKRVYSVVNTRNYRLIGKTISLSDAKKLCDQNPCCIIIDQDGTIMGRSDYGKVPVTSKDIYIAKEKEKLKKAFKLQIP